mgnify:CR=1 FL=1
MTHKKINHGYGPTLKVDANGKGVTIPSNLYGKSIKECQQIAEDIASETFIKNGNKAISFTENDELRIALGGKYESYIELSQIMIAAYNDKQADLILNNL